MRSRHNVRMTVLSNALRCLSVQFPSSKYIIIIIMCGPTAYARSLRGGSGGGHGGGGHSSSYHGSYGGSHHSSGGGDFFFSFVVVVVLFLMRALCKLVVKCIHCVTPGIGRHAGFDLAEYDRTVHIFSRFDAAVSRARERHAHAAAANGRLGGAYGTFSSDGNNKNFPIIFESYGGDFDMIYVDRGRQLGGVVKLSLSNDDDGRNGYIISGNSNDADGRATIREGFATYSGEAWWVEETLAGPDSGLRTLTVGKFEFSSDEFAGTWVASTGVAGRYTYFKGRDVTKTVRSSNAPVAAIVDRMAAEGNLPLAVAVETGPYVLSGTNAEVIQLQQSSFLTPSAPPAEEEPVPTASVLPAEQSLPNPWRVIFLR